jgi:hypothetical protein
MLSGTLILERIFISLSTAVMMPLSVILLSNIEPGELPGPLETVLTAFGFNYRSAVALPVCF